MNPSSNHDEGVPPWERFGAVRRDWESHRGGILVRLAGASFLFGLLSVCFCAPAVVGLPLGVAAYLLARRDLRLMNRNLMDHEGLQQTKEGVLPGSVQKLICRSRAECGAGWRRGEPLGGWSVCRVNVPGPTGHGCAVTVVAFRR